MHGLYTPVPPHLGSPCLGLSWSGCNPNEGLLESVMLGQHCLHSQARQSLSLCWRPWKSWKSGCLYPWCLPWYVESHMQIVWVCLGCCNKYHDWGALNNRYLFLTVLETVNPRSKCKQGWFLLRPLSWLADGSVLPLFSQDLSSTCICIICSSYKDPNQITGML